MVNVTDKQLDAIKEAFEAAKTQRDRLLADNKALTEALTEAIPELEAAAVAEKRANKAPTGLPQRTAKTERWKRASATLRDHGSK